jgi:hypothetical protein
MKITGKRLIAAFLMLIVISTFAGCGNKLGNTGDFSKDIIGKWETWHWYYNETDGEDGFFEDDKKVDWVFSGDGEFNMKTVDGSTELDGKFEWKSKNEADVYLDDGRTFAVECKAEQNHEGADKHFEIQLTRVEDKFTWTLQWVE